VQSEHILQCYKEDLSASKYQGLRPTKNQLPATRSGTLCNGPRSGMVWLWPWNQCRLLQTFTQNVFVR